MRVVGPADRTFDDAAFETKPSAHGWRRIYPLDDIVTPRPSATGGDGDTRDAAVTTIRLFAAEGEG